MLTVSSVVHYSLFMYSVFCNVIATLYAAVKTVQFGLNFFELNSN